ncbi:retrovirus-related Pol polyprotein from transposon 412 [Trichonephila clavata]|uniref:Retrovirus-related Pol polyprotein from transposon 412 n=1 Tax=Trichonephila clavata TaxID=2740835 RepID=A0A8X6J3V5_TRICU|nr:retrovirus-related Pol polyprotein from transposon 412 [Trichonephila clavata]
MEKAFKGANDIMGRGINSMQTFKKHMDKKSNFTKNRKKTLYCSRCTGTNHAKENCRFISSKCNFCEKIGHIQQACFASKKANSKPVKQKQVTLLEEVEDKNRIPLYELKIQECVLHEEELKRPPIMINLKIENKRKISNKQIKPTNIVFKTYIGDSLIPLGYVTVGVQYKNQKVNLNLYIVKENLDTILGREWLYKIHLDGPAIRTKTEQNLNNLLIEYKDIFDDKLGEISNYEAKLKLRPEVKPIFCSVRTVLFALKGRVENEIDRLERS